MASADRTTASEAAAQVERSLIPRIEDLPPLPKLSALQRLYAEPRLRRILPPRAGSALARLAAELLWRIAPRGHAEVVDEMRYLLECSEHASQLPEVARRHVLENARRSELDWHPRLGGSIPVAGLDHLRAAQAGGDGVLAHFMHHGPFAHMLSALNHHGFRVWAPTADFYFGSPLPGLVGHQDRAHLRMLLENCNAFPAGGSFATITGLLRRGEIVFIASDLPGSTPARFLGREIRLSSGTVRLAGSTGARIVCCTWQSRGGSRLPLLQLHPPLDPRAHPDPVALQGAILAIHEPTVLAWPEALQVPKQRWTLAGAPTSP